MNYDHLLTNGTVGMNPNYPPSDKQHACPNCGYCPHCGRGGWQTQPIYPYPSYPNWTTPDWTWRPEWGPLYKETC
jgi:hypothetical protein